MSESRAPRRAERLSQERLAEIRQRLAADESAHDAMHNAWRPSISRGTALRRVALDARNEVYAHAHADIAALLAELDRRDAEDAKLAERIRAHVDGMRTDRAADSWDKAWNAALKAVSTTLPGALDGHRDAQDGTTPR